MLHLYRAFQQVVVQGTMHDAARVLHTSQPTLSRQIQQLEEHLQVALFDRVGKRLVLTGAGELVRQYVDDILRVNLRMQEALLDFADPTRGIVRIGAGLTPAIYFLPPILAEYSRIHPNVRMQVSTGSSEVVLERLLAREVDLGIITTAPSGDEGISVTPLFRDELKVVAGKAHAFAARSVVRIDELNHQALVLMPEGSGLRRIVDEIADAHNLKFQTVLELDSLESIARLVQQGSGLAVLPKSSVDDDIRAGKLLEIHVQGLQLGARTVSLIAQKGRSVSGATKAFRMHLTHLASR